MLNRTSGNGNGAAQRSSRVWGVPIELARANGVFVRCIATLMLVACWRVGGEIPSIDGANNNPNGWGASGSRFLRISFSEYSDGISGPSGADRANARDISNAVCVQTEPLYNDRNLSDYVWQWGQFIDHDIVLTEGAAPFEPFPIDILDPDDPLFNPLAPVIHLGRSRYDPLTGVTDPRQQVNSITSFLDASMVYGADETRTSALRAFEGGKLKTSETENLLPLNAGGLPNANDTGIAEDTDLRLAGDVRANEQPGLTALHSLFLREHNRLAEAIAQENPHLEDEALFQRARSIVRGQVQSITFNEFLPALMGPNAPNLENRSYDPTVNPGIINEFATALFRFGHSMVSGELQRIQDNGASASGGGVKLRYSFFNPEVLHSSQELDYILKGLASQRAQELDTKHDAELRNFLFAQPGYGGLDLAALNIQRGRDHGLPGYNTVRSMLGLSRVTSFDGITRDPELQEALASVYDHPDQVDLFIGALAEDHLPGGGVGALLAVALQRQFSNLMEGDRFFYLWGPNVTEERRTEISQTSLADIIRRNTGITRVQDKVFYIREESLDDDFDGMPNQWELAYDLDPTSASDATIDGDGDGADNLSEFLAGTDPNDADSHFRLYIEQQSPNQVMLRFQAAVNRSCTIYYCDEINDDWKELATMPAASESQTMEMVDEMISTGHRFYRLTVR